MGRSGTGRPCASTLLVGIWGNVRFRSRSRLFCREAGSFAERSVLLPASCCFAYRDFVFDPSKCGPFGTYFPVSWSGPVVMARDDGGRSASVNYKSGKSRKRAKEWPRRTVTGAPETGAQPPQRHHHRAVALLQYRHRHRFLLRPIQTRARPRVVTSGKRGPHITALLF